MKKAPSPLVSLIPIIVLVLLLFATIHTFGSDALVAAAKCHCLLPPQSVSLSAWHSTKIPWKDYELAITNNVAGVTTAIIILLIIGALSGIWMISGVVPTLIYYGMQIIHPSFFLASTCIICVLISVMTGSSWTTIATIGIALMGIGRAQGFEEGWIAGAIISGAYFWRQGISIVGNYHIGSLRHRHSPLPPYPLHDDNHDSFSCHYPDYFHRSGILT